MQTKFIGMGFILTALWLVQAGCSNGDSTKDIQSLDSMSSMPASIEKLTPPPDAQPAVHNKAASIDVLAERLKSRLQTEPDDLNGWVLLAKSYHFLGHKEDANWALSEAKSRGYSGDLPEFNQPTKRRDHLHVFSPNNQWLTDYLNQQIAKDERESEPTPNGITSINIGLSINETLRKTVSEDSAIFVFAREENKTGPPLAVRRIAVGELPTMIRLTDKDSIMPTRLLSSAASVIAVARISKTGDAIRQAGDYEALSSTLDNKNDSTKLIFTADHLIRDGAD